MTDLIPRLQGYLTAAGRDSALAQRLSNMTTMLSGIRIRDGLVATKHFVCNLDAVSLILLTVTLVAFLVPVLILFPPVPVDCSDVLRQTHSRAGVVLRDMNIGPSRSPDRRFLGAVSEGKRAVAPSLRIFPVQSCRGIELERDGVSFEHSEFDRLYTLAQRDSEDGQRDVWQAISREHFPMLASIEVDLWIPDSNKTSRLLGHIEGSFLVLRFPWTDSGLQGILQQAAAKISHGLKARPEKEFLLPVSYPNEEEIRARGYSFAEVTNGGANTMGLNMDVELPTELARYLGAKQQIAIFRVDQL
ncbi:mosc containing protein [Fusarium subglutinans]|uniref:Mosc containing protein n=1 Tax=Gibberella subglutinans TaxID=42677 RepID=A0A8H5V7M3_GIBSU|nr:mosc containing protein [Fusarium subglutinans]KAF5612123.1 mosc containing protein [Fusarium subglutinans]